MGIDADKVEALLKRAQREIDGGVLPACQLAIGYEGEIVVSEAYGDCTTDTRFAVFSATKAIVAATMWTLIGDGTVDISKRVAEYVPEFGTNGKDVVTVEQVMLHTSGFPHAPLGAPKWASPEGRRAAFAKWRLNWEPGSAFEYHPTSAHWVLSAIIENVTGGDYRDEIQFRVTDPCGLPRVLGIPLEEQQGIAELELRGEPTSPDELEAATGFRDLPVTEVTDEALLGFNTPDARAVGVPGAGGVMRAADLARFYQCLLHDDGTIWDPAVRADGIGNVRNDLRDPWTGAPAMRTLGLVVAGDDGMEHLRGHGRTGSPRRFGHDGAAGQLAWADPESGLSFVYVTNGIDANLLRQWRRGIALSSLAAVCVE